ncbi:MAG: hypothetical protein KH135_04495 [Firmicutes bacterium]|nr:hypothetical protein [Bacillota bacterium]
MNNKLLKENATMILYITNFIDSLEKDIECLKTNYSYETKYLDIKAYNQIKEYFEKCLKEISKC